MNQVNTAKVFATSFQHAAGDTAASSFSNALRFIAIMLVIIAGMWSINQFMTSLQQSGEDCFIQLGSRLIRLVIGLCLFILLLIVKGN